MNWSDVTGATKYHARISRDYDFTDIEHEDNNLANSIYTATLTSGVDKYYWQWRHFDGANWQEWNEVQSFERLAGGADLSVTNAKWLMFEASERATYTLEFTYAPQWAYTEEQLWRSAERNLAGDLLSEFRATKGRIHLEFGENNSLSASEKNQVIRYYGMNNLDVYLACAPISNDGTNYYRKLWKVWFTSPPEIRPLYGNETRFVMVLDLEER